MIVPKRNAFLAFLRYSIKQVTTNSFPGPSTRSKWRIGELGQGQDCRNTPRNRGVFCHVTREEMAFSEVVSSVWPLFVFCNRKPLLKRNEHISLCLRDEILTNFWSHFGQGFPRSAILNEEKALGTRLKLPRWDVYTAIFEVWQSWLLGLVFLFREPILDKYSSGLINVLVTVILKGSHHSVKP